MTAGSTDPAWPLSRQTLHLTLVPAEVPPGTDPLNLVDPFVTLSDRGAFSRALLAEVRGSGPAAAMTLVLRLQSDEYPLRAGAESPPRSNPEVEEAWRREAALLERCGPHAGVVTPVEVLPRAPGEPAVLPPTLFCKSRHAFFTACCPVCGGPLTGIRDSRLLEERGLPRFDSSLTRFLGCTPCLAHGESRLWTLVRDPETHAAGVGDQVELFEAYAALARAPLEAGRAPALPCQGCGQVPACYPAEAGRSGDVARALTPLTFYESRAMAVELLHFRYDETAALLGGASFDEILAAVADPGRRAVVGRLEPHFRRPRQHLFAEDMAGKLGLEVLRLKLALFRQLGEAVAAVHRHTRAPHLAIAPERVMVRFREERAGLPNLWSFAAVLLGLGNAFPRPLPEAARDDLPAPLFERPRLVVPGFAAPALRDPPVVEQTGVLTIRQVAEGGGERVRLQLALESDAVDLALLGDKDAVEMVVVQGRPPLSLRLLGSPLGLEGRTLGLRSVPLALPAAERAVVQQLVGQALPRVRFTVHRCLHVPCDVFGLGMMLLATLLAGPEHPVSELADAVGDAAQRLSLFARDRGEAGGGPLAAHAAGLIAAGAGGPFDRGRLFAHPDRAREAARAVPEPLWVETLVIGLRAVTTIRDFSVCRSHTDFDPAHPEVKVEFLLQMVDGLCRRVDAALFGLPGRRGEMRAALASVARQLNLDAAPKQE